MQNNYDVVTKNTNYDVIIVGSRCAGATLAIELGKAGYHILLLDQANFPDTMSQTFPFLNSGVKIAKELDLAPFLEEITSPIIRHIRFQFDDIRIEGRIPVVGNESASYGIKRKDLDFALFKRAISLENVTCLQGFRVTKLLKIGEQVVGVEGINRSGETFQYTANMVIGADGRNSIVRKELNLQPIQDIASDFAYFHGSLSGLEPTNPPHFEVYRVLDRMLAVFPTAKHQHGVYVIFPHSNQKWMNAFQQNPEEAFIQYVKTQFTPINFHRRLTHAKLTTKIESLTNYSNHWYTGMGMGWALAGDAVIFKEPCIAQGVHDAMYGGRYLAKLLKKYPDWNHSANTIAFEYNRHLVEMFKGPFDLSQVLTKQQTMTAEEKMMHQMISMYPEATGKFLGIFNYANSLDDLNKTIEQIMMNQMQ
jgi:2-polyprenyl-6-methoxyphenol hydroxylase-like FAD-dependent oxidoreductase